jgi:hypothetical protein
MYCVCEEGRGWFCRPCYRNDIIQGIPPTVPLSIGIYRLTYPRQVCCAKFFLFVSALECETVAQSCIISHMEQVVTVCAKCFLLKKEYSVVVLRKVAWFTLNWNVSSQNDILVFQKSPWSLWSSWHNLQFRVWYAVSIRKIMDPWFKKNAYCYVWLILAPFFKELTEEEELCNYFMQYIVAAHTAILWMAT